MASTERRAAGARWTWRMVAVLAGLAVPVGATAETVLNRGNTGAVTAFDPHQATSHYEAHVLRDLYDGLVVRTAEASLAPGVATGWRVGGGGTVYTFALDPQAAWSNGDPLTAVDFVRSLHRAVDPALGAPYAALLAAIAEAPAIAAGAVAPDALAVEAPDAHTLTIRLAAPASDFLDLLAHPIAMPVHAEFDAAAPAPVTNGAFRLAERTADGRLVLAPNPHHPAVGEIRLDRVVYHPTPDREAALAAFQMGDLHINNDVPIERIDWLARVMPQEFRRHRWLAVDYYVVGLDQPPWDDPALRHALAGMLDRTALADGVLGGAAFAARRLVPAGIDWYDAVVGPEPPPPSADERAAAVAAMAEAGYGPDNPLALEIRVSDAFHHLQVARAVADMWAPLGIEVTLATAPVAEHFRHLRQGGAFQMARAGWIADTRDPQAFLALFRCGEAAGLAIAGTCNEEVDALLDRAAALRDPAARARVLAEAEALILADAAVLPLFHHASLNLVSTAVEGWQDNVMDIHPSRYLSLSE